MEERMEQQRLQNRSPSRNNHNHMVSLGFWLLFLLLFFYGALNDGAVIILKQKWMVSCRLIRMLAWAGFLLGPQ